MISIIAYEDDGFYYTLYSQFTDIYINMSIMEKKALIELIETTDNNEKCIIFLDEKIDRNLYEDLNKEFRSLRYEYLNNLKVRT